MIVVYLRLAMDPICHDWPNNVIHDITYHLATAYDLTHHQTTACDLIDYQWHHYDITKVHLQILTRMFWGTKDLLVIRVIYHKRRHTRPDNHQLPVTSPICYDYDITKVQLQIITKMLGDERFIDYKGYLPQTTSHTTWQASTTQLYQAYPSSNLCEHHARIQTNLQGEIRQIEFL